MSGKPQLSTYIQDNLKVLLDYDQENNTELVHTLCSYFEHGGNVKQIAQALYVHYNTVVYRLDRIEKLLKISLSNSQQRVSVEVAIRALEIIRKD
jgi:purine catabolism regulator